MWFVYRLRAFTYCFSRLETFKINILEKPESFAVMISLLHHMSVSLHRIN